MKIIFSPPWAYIISRWHLRYLWAPPPPFIMWTFQKLSHDKERFIPVLQITSIFFLWSNPCYSAKPFDVSLPAMQSMPALIFALTRNGFCLQYLQTSSSSCTQSFSSLNFEYASAVVHLRLQERTPVNAQSVCVMQPVFNCMHVKNWKLLLVLQSFALKSMKNVWPVYVTPQ